MQLKFEIEYEHVAYINGPKGQQIMVGHVLVQEEDKEKQTNSILLRFVKGIPQEVIDSIQKEPRILNYVKLAKKSTGIVLLPEIGD